VDEMNQIRTLTGRGMPSPYMDESLERHYTHRCPFLYLEQGKELALKVSHDCRGTDINTERCYRQNAIHREKTAVEGFREQLPTYYNIHCS
jgi:hypothetical protein